MKRTIKLAVVAALALGATSAFATNGATMIGVGAKARGMGGTGIGVGHGAESALANPALITTIKGNNEVSFGGTVFMPDVKTDALSGGAITSESDADFFVIPSVSLATKVNDNFYWGIGMWGTGGLGVDYRGDTTGTTMNMVTALQTMQFAVPLAYTTDGFTIAMSPIIQYSSLDINYNNGNVDPNYAGTGAGVSQDVAIGYNLGLSYEANGITIGAVYKSEIEFNIDDVLTNALDGMGGAVPGNAGLTKMETPSEYGVGVSYTTSGHTLAIDWKQIKWEDAKVYQDFGWEDQDVFAIGYEYATDGWAVRAGYQYAEAAVQDNAGKGLYLDQNMDGFFGASNLGSVTNTFNAIGFPGTMESHITLGGTYVFNDTLSVDLAAVYGLEDSTTVGNFMGTQTNVKHSEQGYTVQLNYAF